MLFSRIILPVVILMGAAGAQAATFTVTSNGDAPDASPGNGVCATAEAVCTLRAALQEANALPGTDVIVFAIPGSDVMIAPTSALPVVTSVVTIDGTTQPGSGGAPYAGVPRIRLDGALAGDASGLHLLGGSSTVRGLMITRFRYNGIAMTSTGPGVNVGAGNTIAGNYIGTDGTNDLGNGGGIHIGMARHTIGGPALADRNVISGNGGGIGLTIGGPNNPSALIQNNYIGLNAAGTAAIGNDGDGIRLSYGSMTAIGNVISGNGGYGIEGDHGSNTIQGNIIGLDASGSMALGNRLGGMLFHNAWIQIGGVEPGTRNVISGNGGTGIWLNYAVGNGRIEGNYIGTDASGMVGIGNAGDGILIGSDSGGNTIGGTAPGAGNLISSNGGSGIHLSGEPITYGGVGTIIQGNVIGLNASATSPLGNTKDGVWIERMPLVSIGGTTTGMGNVISGNGGRGVAMVDAYPYPPSGQQGHRVQQNLIYGNGASELDLREDGPTPNDPGDADYGVNNLQNYPEIVTSPYDAGTNTIAVTFSVPTVTSAATYPLTVEFYRANGDGADLYLGAVEYTAAEAGTAVTKTFTPAGAVTTSDFIVATATDAAGRTSEFSPVPAPLPVELLAFSAATDGADAAVLRWTTASETNNAGFGIEQRAYAPGAADAWQEVRFVPGHGTTHETHAYSARVPGLTMGVHRFRLRQVDLSGAVTYSAAVEVTVGLARSGFLEVQGATLRFAVPEAQPVRVDLFNVLGQRLATLFEGEASAGRVHIMGLPGHLGAGVYLARMQGASFTQTASVLIR